MSFAPLGLSDALLDAVAQAGYSDPTPIQTQTVPAVLAGRDIIGVAQTGTGKTAAFVLPMIDILGNGRARARMPRSLILAPTRELAAQVSENFVKYGKNHKLKMVLLIGGVAFGDQDKALMTGVDVLIATPGRFLDQFERGKILLSGVDILVIDEADRMLDMGFIPDVEKICALLPPKRQTLLFSATMPGPVKKLADRFLRDPKLVEVSRAASTNADIRQEIRLVSSRGKREALRQILADPDLKNAIVFSNRKTTVRELYDSLKKSGFPVGQIHGDMEQADRIREFDRFKAGDIRALIASDVAARGLDVKGVSHIVNYDVPHHAEDYVHRIGRTGRAGAKGTAITLATEADAEAIADVEKLIGQKIPRAGERATAPGASARAAPELELDDAAEADAPRASDRRRPRGGSSGEAPRPSREAVRPAREAVRPARTRAAPTAEPTRAAAPDPVPPRAEPPAQRATAARRSPPPAPMDDDEWEGPVPAFLSLSAR